MSVLPASVDLVAYHGDTWAQTFRFLKGDAPLDLTGATVEAWAGYQARYSPREEYEHTPLTVAVADPTSGEVTLGMPDPPLEVGEFDYDVEVVEDGNVTTWVRGRLRVEQDVTNAD